MTAALVPYGDDDRHDRDRRDDQAERDAQQAKDRADAEVEVQDLMRRAYELHIAGVPYRKMETELRVPKSTLQRMVRRYIRQQAPLGDVAVVVSEQLAEVRFLRRRIVADYITGKLAGNKVVDALLKLQLREQQLAGGFTDFSVEQFQGMTEDQLKEWLRS